MRRECLAHEALARLLAPPVDAQRVDRVELVVRPARSAVEDVVAGQVDHRRAGQVARARHRPGARGVDRHRGLRVGLAGVDLGERGAVDDHIGQDVADRRDHRRLLGDVQLRPWERDDLVAREGAHDVTAQLAGRAGDEDAHGLPAGRGGHQPAPRGRAGLLQRPPPPVVGPVPGDRGVQRLLEAVARRPAQGADLGGVDAVAQVVARPVGDVADARLGVVAGEPEALQQRERELAVRHSLPAPTL